MNYHCRDLIAAAEASAERDGGHTVERCISGLRASEALSVTPGERRMWEGRIRYWQEQLAFAQRRS